MSIQHILVPTDFSHAAMQAVHYAANLAEALGARLTLLHVCNTGRTHYHLSWASAGLHVEEMSEEEDARTRLQRLSMPLNARGILTHVAVMGPLETIPGILEAADHSDLVVLASQTWTGRQPAKESISLAVAHKAPCPVLLVDADASLRTTGLLVLVPTDLSEASAVALRLARELTAALGGTVEVVHALSDGPEAATWGGEPVEAEDELPEARRQRYVERFVEAAGGALVPIELRLVEGPPIDAIARVASEDHPDLVVVGRPADRPDAPDPLLDATTSAASCPTLRAPSPMRSVVSPPDGPRAITDADFPQDGPPAAQLGAMLNWAVLAPSVMNTQPWRFRIVWSAPGRARAELYVDRARQLVRVDPEGREAVISCGAALFTLRLAARHYGFATVVTYASPEDDPDLIATLELAGPSRASAEEEALFRAIKARHTNRDPYADLNLPTGLIADLSEAATQEGARLHTLTGDAEKGALADLIAEAIRTQGEDEATVNELRAWLRPLGDRRSDGVPDDVQGGWDRLSYLRTDAGSLAAAARRLALAAPALLVLSTERDTRRDWACAGQALQRVLLLATSNGLAASYFNQPTELPALRTRIAGLAGQGHPQLVFRLGTPIEADGTPRRAVASILKPDDLVA